MNSALAALTGLVLAIVLIIRKVSPFYSLMLGALAGGLLSGIGLEATVGQMLAGVKDMVFYFRPVGWDYPYLIDIPEGYATWYTSECRGENDFCYVFSTLKS